MKSWSNISGIPDREPDEINQYETKIWKLDKSGNYIVTFDKYGDRYWYLDGRRHREDGPAVEYFNGQTEWFKNGKRHRENGPAIEWIDGSKCWYRNDQYHREDGPAVEYLNGPKEWWLNGKKIKPKDYSYPQRWQKLVELERIRQVMED